MSLPLERELVANDPIDNRDKAIMIIDKYIELKTEVERITESKLLYSDFGLTYEGVKKWRDGIRSPRSTSLAKIEHFFEFKNFQNIECTVEEFLERIEKLPQIKDLQNKKSAYNVQDKILSSINGSWVIKVDQVVRGRNKDVYILHLGSMKNNFSLYTITSELKLFHILDGNIIYKDYTFFLEGSSERIQEYISIKIDIQRYIKQKKKAKNNILYLDMTKYVHHRNIRVYREDILSKRYIDYWLHEIDNDKTLYYVFIKTLVQTCALFRLIKEEARQNIIKDTLLNAKNSFFFKSCIENSNYTTILNLQYEMEQFQSHKETFIFLLDTIENEYNRCKKYYILLPLIKKFKIKHQYLRIINLFSQYINDHKIWIQMMFIIDQNLQNKYQQVYEKIRHLTNIEEY